MWPKYGRCSTCLGHWRIEPMKPYAGSTGFIKFCPMCGSGDAIEFTLDPKLDYWYVLAEGFGLTPNLKGATLVKGLYDLWDSKEYFSFGDFVRATLKEHVGG